MKLAPPKSVPMVALGSLTAVLSTTACKTGTSTSTSKDIIAPLAPAIMTFNRCGNASNTQICLSSDGVYLQMSDGGQTTQFPVSSAEASSSLANATAYIGVADLSFIAGFGPGTQIAFVVSASTGQAILKYLSTSGWVNWPSSGTFFTYDPTHPAIAPLAPPPLATGSGGIAPLAASVGGGIPAPLAPGIVGGGVAPLAPPTTGSGGVAPLAPPPFVGSGGIAPLAPSTNNNNN